jgi:hypothetical protein
MTAAPRDLIAAVEALIAAVDFDEGAGGGLLSRETLRKAAEVRLALHRFLRQREVAS